VLSLKHYICEAIADRSDIARQSLHDQWHHLVLRPLSKLDGHSCQSSYVLVVDALDECDDENNVQIILQLLAEVRSLEKLWLKVFLTSRPEIQIRRGFYQVPAAQHQDFVLHNISPSIVDHDISLFLKYNMALIGQENSLEVSWPGEEVIKSLVRNASGLFIWAAIACRFVRTGLFADESLCLLLEGSTSTTAPEKHLNELYITVLQNSVCQDYTEHDKEKLYSMLRHILGSIVTMFSLLPANSLSRLLDISKQKVDRVLKDLHAILDIPKDQTRSLRLHHPSFRDFLLDEARCYNQNFQVNEKQAHQTLVGHCIKLMSTTLRRDICDLQAPGTTEIESSRVQQCLFPEVQYACIYWVQHIQKSCAQLYDNDQVHQFLQKHFLHWLEALSLMRKISEGVLALTLLEAQIPVSHIT
jgi:hypothetical protein